MAGLQAAGRQDGQGIEVLRLRPNANVGVPDLTGDPWSKPEAMDSRFRDNDINVRSDQILAAEE